jgi:hypothetical protein
MLQPRTGCTNSDHCLLFTLQKKNSEIFSDNSIENFSDDSEIFSDISEDFLTVQKNVVGAVF